MFRGIFKIGGFSKVGMTVLVIFSLGCNVRQVQKAKHENAAPENAVHLDTTPASDPKLESKDLTKLNKKLAAVSSAPEALAMVNDLSEFINNKNYVENPRFSNSVKLKAVLGYYNQALLKLHELSPQTVKDEKLFEKYLLMVKSGCNEQLNHCLNLSFFSSDYRSALIVKAVTLDLDAKIDSLKTEKETTKKCASSECLKAIHDYYGLLQLGFVLKNRVKDDDIDFLYIKRARDYVDYFNSLPAGQRNGDLIHRHVAVFENIISSYPADPQNPRFRDFISNFKPWTHSRLEADPFPFGTKRMFSYAAGSFLYVNTNGIKKLNPDFVEALKASQEESDKFGDSFFENVRLLRKDYANILKSFSIEPSKIDGSDFLNEYFFIVDRLYRGHLDVDEVSQIWIGSDKNEENLFSTLEYYLKIQVLRMVVKTSAEMSAIYATKNLNTREIIYDVIRKSKEISDQWVDMVERFERLSLFLGRNLKKQGVVQKSYDEKIKMFDSLRRNIKYISAYPNKMMMVYYSAFYDSLLTFNSYFGEIKIDPGTVIEKLFSGTLEPWLRFVNTDPKALNMTELIYAFYFTVATNVFETYGAKVAADGSTVDYRKFFKLVMNGYLHPKKTQLEDSLRELRQLMRDSQYGAFLETCQVKEKTGNYRVTVGSLESLKNYAFVGNGNAGITISAQKFYGTSVESALRTIRTDLDVRLRPIRTMIDILNYSSDVNGGREAKSDALNYVNGEIRQIEELKRTYYGEVLRQHRKISKCLNELTDFERVREREIIAEEKAFLGEIWDSMQVLKTLDGDNLNRKIQELQSKFKYDEISKTEFKYSQLGLYLRLFDKMSKKQPGIDLELPGDLTRLGSHNIKKPVKTQLEDGQNVSRDDFIKTALSYWNGTSNESYIDWIKPNHNLNPQEEKITTLIELYKLGRELGLPTEELVKPEEIIGEVFRLQKLISITPEDQEVLKLLSMKEKVDRGALSDRLFDAKNGSVLGILDWFYSRIAGDQDSLQEAKEFFSTINSIGYFLFAPSLEVKNIMRKNYRPLVLRHDEWINSFEAAVTALEAKYSRNDLENLRIIFRLREDGSPDSYVPEINSANNPLFISTTRRNKIRSAMQAFHERDTGYYYYTKPGDPECLNNSKIRGCVEEPVK